MRVPSAGLILLGLLPWAAAPAAAQDPVPDSARVVPLDTLETPAADTLETPASDSAAPPRRTPYVPPRLAVSVSAGTLGFGDLQNQPVMAVRLDEEGARTDSAALERRLAAEEGLQVTVSALLGLTRAWAVRAAATWGRASLAGGYAGEDPFEGDARALRPAASTELTILGLEAGLRFRMLSGRRVQPYAELGISGLRLEAEDPSFPGAAELAGETSLAGLAALGAIIPIRGPIAARVQATGQWLRTPAGTVEAEAPVAAGDTLEVRFLAPPEGRVADPARELLRVVRLDIGLSVELGAAARPRAAAAGRPSGSRP